MPTVLVIDDNNDIRENTAEILQLAGYTTCTAENGKAGVELALRNKHDIIVCDIMMPVLDGYGVLHLLNKNAATRNIPFIFLSAKTERGDLRKGMEMGADDYITKPFEEIELLRAIEVRLNKQQALSKQYLPAEQGLNDFLQDIKEKGFIQHLTENYEVVPYHKKQILYQQGERPRYLFLLTSGKIKAVQQQEDGKEYISDLYSDGDFIGYTPLLEEKNYDDTTVIMEDALLLQLPREDFIQLMYSDMAVTTRFIQLLTRSLRQKQERLLTLAYSSLRKRIAKALLDIHEKYSTDTQDYLEITRDDIARYVGTATESLIRTLSDFKSEKLILIEDGKVILDHPEKLRRLLY